MGTTAKDEVSQMERAKQDFGEISYWPDPIGIVRPYSEKVNPVASHWFYVVDSDRNWYALPCVSQNGYHLYTSPVSVLIGRDFVQGFGIVPEEGWDEILRAVHIPDRIIKGIRDFLNSKPPIEWK